MNKIRRNLLVSLFALIAFARVAPAQFSPGGFALQQEQKRDLVKLTLSFDKASYQPGETVQGMVEAAIEHEWHINSARPKDEFAIPSELKIESAALEKVEVSYPPHVERAFTFANGAKLAVYEGTIQIPFRAVRSSAGDLKVRAALHYQACNDTVCLPPRDEVTEGQLGAKLFAATPKSSAANFTPLASAPATEEISFWSRLRKGDVQGIFQSSGVGLTFLLVFLGGLLLTLTPCVYPLIPLTVSFFSSQTEGKGGRRAALAISYVLGIAVTYSALGVVAALSGQLFGAWLQHPAVVIFFALLMLGLAASMFGAYDIRVPHFISDRASARAGVAGSLVMGLLGGIVAAPCVGPVISGLILFVAQKGDPLFGFALFFVLALGLGLPFLFLGIFSTTVSSLPRSGMWMVQIKQLLGFVLVAMAFYFLRSLIGDTAYGIGVALSLLAGALFMFFRGKVAVPTVNAIRLGSALLLLAGGSFFLYQALKPREATIQWTKYDEQHLAAAVRKGKPVMIDFYADWCLPCKELDHKTFTHQSVRSESDRFVPLKADLTRTADQQTKLLSERYKIIGVPTIIFVDSTGREIENLRLTGFEEASKFLGRMKQVK